MTDLNLSRMIVIDLQKLLEEVNDLRSFTKGSPNEIDQYKFFNSMINLYGNVSLLIAELIIKNIRHVREKEGRNGEAECFF